jgi:hypothetical protein
MRVGDICTAVKGKVICGADKLDVDIEYAFASDLMSDVLTVRSDSLLLITGLANLQTIRTAEMSDALCILFVRDKSVTSEMKQLAEESGIPLITCSVTMFKAAGELYKAGLKPLF